ncbi:MAG: hypothetical protein AB8B93_12965, partial [Pseudomonadales bacterium]
MASYQVLFSGELADGAQQAAVQRNLARELGIDAQKSNALFSGRTVVLKSQLDEASALQWQARLNDLGALCRIKDLDVKSVSSASFKSDNRANDHTLRDITAAHLECPRCSHLQLDTSHCARCGVDLAAAFKQKRKEDLIIERKINALRTTQSMPAVSAAGSVGSAATGHLTVDAANDD